MQREVKLKTLEKLSEEVVLLAVGTVTLLRPQSEESFEAVKSLASKMVEAHIKEQFDLHFEEAMKKAQEATGE